MAIHTIKGNGIPSIIPPSEGCHYTNLETGDTYMAAGTNSIEDWKLQINETRLAKPESAGMVGFGSDEDYPEGSVGIELKGILSSGGAGKIQFDEGMDYPEGSVGKKIKDGDRQAVDQLRSDLNDYEDPQKGAAKVAFNSALSYPEKTVGHALRKMNAENAAWAGFFEGWVMGFSRSVGTAEREQIPAGVTHGRAGFVAGTTIYQSGPGEIRVQRNAGDSSSANHTVCINLSSAETAPLRGKKCTAHAYARAGASYSGAGVTLRVQYSVEPEQPVISSVAHYTSGHEVLDTVTFVPELSFGDLPHTLTFDVPEDATQVAISFVIPFSGTAGANDYIELHEAAIYVSDEFRAVRQPGRAEVDAKSATRYQTSYPYGSSFGANSAQGAVNAISRGTAATWALSADVRFSHRMVVAPRFQFIAPGSGIRSRLLNVGAGTFVNGLAYDLSDSGVTVTNNGAVVSDARHLFQWAADCLF